LQVKATLALALVILATLAAGGGLFYVVAREAIGSGHRRMVDRLAQGISLPMGRALESQDTAQLNELAGKLLSSPSVQHVTIVDAQGRQVISAGDGRFSPLSAGTLNSPGLSFERAGGSRTLVLGRPILIPRDDGRSELAGGLRMVIDTTDINTALGKVRARVALVGVGIFLLVLPLACLLIWRLILLPIRRLSGATAAVAAGNLSVRLDRPCNDELGELAGTFNRMAERLQLAQDQLRGINADLEKQVCRRTEQLERANNHLREEASQREGLLRAVGHDLAAPLRNIDGMASVILLKWQGVLPEDAVARLQRIKSNVQIETELLGDLQEVNRLATVRQRRTQVDFGQLFQQLRDTFEHDLKTRGIDLKISPDMPVLRVEAGKLRQVFANLIDNAIKYGRAGGQIAIGYRHCDGEHVFGVADDGAGIPPEDHERIFFVFQRSASPEVAAVPGKGIGLAVVRAIVSTYEGRVWVKSAPGEGSTFFVALPDVVADQTYSDASGLTDRADTISAGTTRPGASAA
jgi:signal transduction histidine kinase